MAAGDFFIFDQFLQDTLRPSDTGKLHHFGGTPNEVKCAIIDSVVTPAVDTADPHWGGTGTTNFLTNEVATTPAYVTGGNVCATPTVTINAGVIELDWADPAAWAADVGGDTDARWAIFYNNTNAHKKCIGYMDLGAAFDMSSGPLTVQMGNPAATLNQTP